jgi:hypothetical protein
MWFMRQGPGKSLYIFLCTVLGVMLFVVLQRSLALIHFILLNTNYQLFSFGLDPATLELINYISIGIAGFFGGWYGTWLGLHWHEVVYEKAQSGFKRVPQDSNPTAKPAPATKFSGGIKLVPIPEPKTVPVTAPAATVKPKPSWNVDDLMPKPKATMPAVASKTPSRSGISRASSVAPVTTVAKAKPVAKKTAPAVAAPAKKTVAKKVTASTPA